jgi:indolepyruvate ferredoxin oxidoreductase
LLLEKLRFVAGSEQVETFDAQTLAEEFLGDTITSNILALGFAWQRSLVPVSLEALTRAIELNGVAVESNLLAFSLGRLVATDSHALESLRAAPSSAPEDDSVGALVSRGVAHLRGYQNAAWAQRYERQIRRVEAREAALEGGDRTMPLTRNVALSLLKLMSYKDEYEVARLYTHGGFQQKLAAQFEGDVKLEFHMAPPVLSRPKNGQAPAKIRLGSWMMPAMKWLAHGRVLRGTFFDVFGRTDERRMERALIGQFEARLDELLAGLTAGNQLLAAQIAALPLVIRGFGHVKIANLAMARARESELLHKLQPTRYPKPVAEAKAGQIKGIAIVAR